MLERDAGLQREAKIDGWPVNVSSLSDLLEGVVRQLKSSAASFMVCTLNLDHIVKLRRDVEFRGAYSRALYVTADGFPIVTLARLSGYRIERTTGADLIQPICKVSVEQNFPIFLMGSSLRTLCASASRLVGNHPGLEVCGVIAPPRGFDPKSTLAQEITEVITRSGARICFVALGAPRQEIYCAAAMEKTAGICFLPIGAGLDFIAGSQLRAPTVFRRLKLEWAWRLVLNPTRLFIRYSRCAVLFLELLFKHYCFPRPRRAG
jgi:N-acetylglucosaminyldiphosphoundecaprenol N-acetyl-beta-D-mannosaminyltransferase